MHLAEKDLPSSKTYGGVNYGIVEYPELPFGGVYCFRKMKEDEPKNREGLDFLRWLHKKFPDIPTIAMSAIDDPSLSNDSIKAGAQLFHQKPLRISELKIALKNIIK